MEETPFLEMIGINKYFPGVHAVQNVDFELRKGEIHALVGENGAGKSTLMKVLAGVHPPETGEIRIEGQVIRVDTPAIARITGIAMVHQELKLASALTVAENIFLGAVPTNRYGLVDWKRVRQGAIEALAVLNIKMDVDRKVSELTVAEMQLVEIAKALTLNAKIIIMDEPSAVLTPYELQQLFSVLKAQRDRGVSIIYISHRLEEIFELADRVTVMKDGAKVKTLNVSETDKWEIVKLMVGRELGKHYPKRTHEIGEPVLELKNVTRKGKVENISFTLHRGEILGIAGLIGAGRSELATVIFGAEPLDAGEIWIHGKPVKIASPGDALKHRMGFVTEDRRQTGLFGILTVRENITIASLRKFTRRGFMNLRRELEIALDFIKRIRIVTPSPNQQVQNLSGGNQQRVLLSKWINTDSEIFLIDEPTRGIDVGSKEELYFLLNDLVANGAAILMISSELPEILGMSDRILVMNHGRITAEFQAAEATEVKIMEFAALEVVE